MKKEDKKAWTKAQDAAVARIEDLYFAAASSSDEERQTGQAALEAALRAVVEEAQKKTQEGGQQEEAQQAPSEAEQKALKDASEADQKALKDTLKKKGALFAKHPKAAAEKLDKIASFQTHLSAFNLTALGRVVRGVVFGCPVC